MSSTRQKRHQRTKTAILTAARHIIREKGADALSIRAIAKAIDYSPAGLYEYFGSKEAIIDAVCAEGHQQLYEHLTAVDEALPDSDYMVALGEAYIQFALTHPEHFLLMFTHLSNEEIAPETRLANLQQVGSGFTVLHTAVQRLISRQTITLQPPLTSLDMAYTVWSLVHGLAMLRLTFLRNLPLNFSAADHHALDSFWRGHINEKTNP